VRGLARLPTAAGFGQQASRRIAARATSNQIFFCKIGTAVSEVFPRVLPAVCRRLLLTPVPVHSWLRQQQECLALLTNSGHLSILRFNAACCRSAAAASASSCRFTHRGPLAPSPPNPACPSRSICTWGSYRCRFTVVQQLALPPDEPGDPLSLLAVHPGGRAVAAASVGGTLCLAARQAAGAGPPFQMLEPVSLRSNVLSLCFEETLAPTAAGGPDWQAGHPFCVAALHQVAAEGSFSAAQYSVGAAGAAGQRCIVQRVAQYKLQGGASRGGPPRGLVPPPPMQGAAGWAAAPGSSLLVLRECGVEFVRPLRGSDGPAQHAQQQPGDAAPSPRAAPASHPASAVDEPAAARGGGAEPMELWQELPQEGQLAAQLQQQQQQQPGEVEMREADADSASSEAAPAGMEEDEAEAEELSPSGGGTASRPPMITACCWEVGPGVAAGAPPAPPALACALEDGSLCRLAPPAAAAPLPPPPHVLSPQRCPEQQRLAQAVRSLAALPGGLLVACTDGGGLQLLRSSSRAAGEASEAAAAAAPGAAVAAAPYEPLLPAHLLAAQQAAPGWEAGPAGRAGCCTLPAAAALADCQLADLEGGGQAQLYAACRATGGGASPGGGLCVLYPDPKPEAAFELPGAAEVRALSITFHCQHSRPPASAAAARRGVLVDAGATPTAAAQLLPGQQKPASPDRPAAAASACRCRAGPHRAVGPAPPRRRPPPQPGPARLRGRQPPAGRAG
jgi:hypothetical protein